MLAGGLSFLPAFIALGGLVYWLVGLLLGWLIHFYTYDGATIKFLIREGFRGQVIIIYDWPGGVTPAMFNRARS